MAFEKITQPDPCRGGGGGNLMLMGLSSRLHEYRQNSASAHAAPSTIRSIVAVCLPLATQSMYSNLGVQWATSLLGFITAFMAIIPFVFVKHGADL
ncbi:hypothetical protein N7475_009077 [Penicillium sp. IBT 31633x]|nr:hypothetical protein N7475_009077 [Penicillium sp. IBT 31633x]